MVATTSETQCVPEARCLVEIEIAAFQNITLARMAPPMHPTVWNGREAAASRHFSPPKAASTKDTTGLKWAPEIGPNIKMMANRPVAVAAAFSKSWSPALPGDSVCAAIPEPMTIVASKALPRNSDSNLLHRMVSRTAVLSLPSAGQQQAEDSSRSPTAAAGTPWIAAGTQHAHFPAIPLSAGASAVKL